MGWLASKAEMNYALAQILPEDDPYWWARCRRQIREIKNWRRLKEVYGDRWVWFINHGKEDFEDIGGYAVYATWLINYHRADEDLWWFEETKFTKCH